jgi:hypothetical protein
MCSFDLTLNARTGFNRVFLPNNSLKLLRLTQLARISFHFKHNS